MNRKQLAALVQIETEKLHDELETLLESYSDLNIDAVQVIEEIMKIDNIPWIKIGKAKDD